MIKTEGVWDRCEFRVGETINVVLKQLTQLSPYPTNSVREDFLYGGAAKQNLESHLIEASIVTGTLTCREGFVPGDRISAAGDLDNRQTQESDGHHADQGEEGPDGAGAARQ